MRQLHPPSNDPRLRIYLQLVAGILLIQGVAVLLLMVLSITLPSPLNRAVPPDGLHAWIHIVWALALGVAVYRSKVRQVAVEFYIFYFLLALLGFLSEAPLGLQLGLGENLFHVLIGAIALWLSQTQRNPPSTRS